MELFPCYSIPLMKWLVNEKGIRYKLVALNANTKKTMYIFIDDDNLKDALNEWKETKPI